MSAFFSKTLSLAPVAAALSALALTTAATAGGLTLPAPAQPAEQTDQLIIKYRSGTAAAARADLQTMSDAHTIINRAGAQMRPLRTGSQGAHIMRLDRRLGVAELDSLARSIAAHPDVEFAEPDRRMHILLTPNDTSYLSQWHYYEAAGGLNAPAAWDQTTGTGIVVAVIDTGYLPHADLVANIVSGYDMISTTAVSNDGDLRDSSALDPGDWVVAGECGTGSTASDSSWHGTHVAGTIAAVTNNASGVAGVAHGARVQPVRALGKCGGYTSDIADSIVWASGGAVTGAPANATPARVISLSLGGSGSCGAATQAAIEGARSRGAVVVVAAGNSNTNVSTSSPANCAGVIAVAAVGRTGGRAYYSNYGTAVDVAAPGGDTTGGFAVNGVLSTLNTGTTTPGADTYAYYQGTSMATPHVSAVAALMLAKNPALTPDQVEGLLKSSARAFPATCSQCGTGIVDATAAVNSAAAFVAPTITTLAEVESNNTTGAAQLAAANPVNITGSIATSTDTDYFRVTLGAGKTLTGSLTPPSSANFDLYVYRSNGKLAVRSTKATGLVDSIAYQNTATTSATVYVRVLRVAGTGAYTLSLSQ